MTRNQRHHVDALVRRRTELDRRLSNWVRGDRDRTRAEVAALCWALNIVANADAAGLLADFDHEAAMPA